ncbi:hypothetical protein [Kocuria nitroreducens]|uniref:hypothetical protein n=1 Tax=Kocuria nitroreducens TaxID=3058914 RepID=UPI0036DF284E
MEQIQHASLVCASCLKECDHEVTYAGRLVAAFKCSNCGTQVNIQVADDYFPDVGRRLASKPRRMMRRFRKHPLGYTLSLPRAVATKPREVLGEVRLAIASRQPAEYEGDSSPPLDRSIESPAPPGCEQ